MFERTTAHRLKATFFLFLWLGVPASVLAESHRLHAVDESLTPYSTRESATAQNTPHPLSDLPSDKADDSNARQAFILTSLEKYAAYLDLQMADLAKQNATLLGAFDHYGWKIGGYAFKAGLEAYGAEATISTLKTAVGGSLAAATLARQGVGTSREALEYWMVKGGGKDFLVTFGLNVLGSGVANKATSNNANWTSFIPVWSSITSTHQWAKQMFTASDQIAQNGVRYRELLRERNKVQRLIDQYQSH